jgi:hypothetical protein
MISDADFRHRKRSVFWGISASPWRAVAIYLSLLLLPLVLWALPILQVRHSPLTTAANRFEREDAARKTLAQIVGGIFLLSGFYMSFKTFHLSREGHITDRFTKAIEQLGKMDGAKPNFEVRLGAIYALERIALDSPRDHWTMVEILTAYVRQNAPVGLDRHCTESDTPRIDIQAILTVLGRRETDTEREQFSRSVYLSLMPSFLCGANLNNANLKGADLEKVVLKGASFWGADLRGAALIKANLQDADLRAAKLEGAFFREAMLEGADLEGANLCDAHDLTIEQIQSAKHWHLAHFSSDLQAKLGLCLERADNPARERS